MTQAEDRGPNIYRPRLSIDITEEHRQALDKHLGSVHGLQKAVFIVIIEDLVKMLEGPNGQHYLSAFLQRYIELSDIIRKPE